MTRSISCEGDRTSHDGTVKSVSGTLCINGRRNARVGDWVSCPAHGDNQIIEGGILLDNGNAVVLHGCRSQCGSRVIGTSTALVSV